MAKPVPSPTEAAAINQSVAELNNQSSSLSASAAAQTGVIAQKQQIDNAFKNLFAWYNDSIIGKYDAERKAINGSYIAAPIVEADIVSAGATPPSGRLIPVPPITPLVRIPEFDGTAYTSTTTLNELQHISEQQPWINYLMVGYPGTLPTVTATTLTTSALTSSSTTLGVNDAVGPASFSVGDVLIVHNGGTDAAVVLVTASTPDVLPPLTFPPPYGFTLGITVVIPPTGTIAIGGSVLAGFTGFTNVERTAKITSDPSLQPLMNYLIVKVQNPLNARLVQLTAQLSALNTNDDPDGVTAITTAKNNATAAQSFITNYLITTDISDTGLNSLITEYTNRSTYLGTRITAIIAAYTGQTENYYNKRYETANNRGDLSRGTLRALSNAQNVQNVLNGMVGGVADTVAALTGIL